MTHVIMMEYKVHKFEITPCLICSKHIKFVASSSWHDVLEKLVSCISTWEAFVKSLTADLNKANTIIGGAQNKTCEAKKAVEE